MSRDFGNVVRGCLLAVMVLGGVSWPQSGQTAYGEECQLLARKLAQVPGALQMGELELIKNCISVLQRGIVLGESLAVPAELPSPSCAPAAPVIVPECPVCQTCPPPTVCPTADKLCERSAPPPARKEPERAPTPDNRRLRPYLPTY